jgi:hypothetical protein
MSVWAYHDDRDQAVGGPGERSRRLLDSLLVVCRPMSVHARGQQC